VSLLPLPLAAPEACHADADEFPRLACGPGAIACARPHALALARFDTVSCQRVK
jgi:hypothetical protein